MHITLDRVTKSHLPKKKYDAHLIVDGKIKIVPFGAKGYSDYTQHKDKIRKNRYITRHHLREDWSNPLSPGFWSRWYLWEEPTKEQAEKKLINRFGL